MNSYIFNPVSYLLLRKNVTHQQNLLISLMPYEGFAYCCSQSGQYVQNWSCGTKIFKSFLRLVAPLGCSIESFFEATTVFCNVLRLKKETSFTFLHTVLQK